MKIKQIFGIALAGFFLLNVMQYCSEEKSPTEVNTHPEGWNNVNSVVFHGAKVVENDDFKACQDCHGQTLSDGGASGIACTDCHNSGQVESALRHPQRVKDLHWNLEGCQVCHGENYAGMNEAPTCESSSCHVRDEGPESCVTCHGDFSKTFTSGALTDADIAPPEALSEEVRPLDPGVGYHQYHVETIGVNCTGCHGDDVDRFDDEGHIDDGIAEVNALYIKSWNRSQGTCTSVCHTDDAGTPVTKNWVVR
ncbi:MAG: hypothetical protein GF372_00400 [Candidatus Marinimicrobia bacterium]|nr:hypothetical protein [Candidatus Neomarinimicrobiota bacterium]